MVSIFYRIAPALSIRERQEKEKGCEIASVGRFYQVSPPSCRRNSAPGVPERGFHEIIFMLNYEDGQ